MRNGGDVFACYMEMTKAFDLVVHSKLLSKLLAASMPAIVLRLLLVMYLTQYADVRWNGVFSEKWMQAGCSALSNCILCV